MSDRNELFSKIQDTELQSLVTDKHVADLSVILDYNFKVATYLQTRYPTYTITSACAFTAL